MKVEGAIIGFLSSDTSTHFITNDLISHRVSGRNCHTSTSLRFGRNHLNLPGSVCVCVRASAATSGFAAELFAFMFFKQQLTSQFPHSLKKHISNNEINK